MAGNRLLLLTAILLSAGCTRSENISTAAKTTLKPTTISAGLPSLPGASPSANGQRNLNDTETRSLAQPPPAAPPPALPEMVDLFAPPKVVVPVVTREPEVKPQVRPVETPQVQPAKKPLPQLRLVGFVEMEGLKALLAIDGKLNAVTIGDSPEGLQILAIEPPAVTLRQGNDGDEFQMNLYEQPWFHQPGAVARDRKKPGGQPIISPAPNSGRSLTSTTSGATPAITMPGARFSPSLSPPGVQGPPGAGMPPGLPGLPAFGAPSSPGSKREKD